MPDDNRAAFTPEDLRLIRWLALALGIITAIECMMAIGTEMLLVAIGLNVVTMILCPLAIYLLRRNRAK